MMLVEETTVAADALPVAHFKDHLLLGTGFAEDGVQDVVLESFLRAAIAAVEARTGKILLEREFTWSVRKLRNPARLDLPLAPVSSITAVILRDHELNDIPVDPARIRFVPDSQCPHLSPLGAALPSVPVNGELRVAFVAGFGPDWADLPADLGQAVMMLAAHYYEFRSEVGLGAGCMPFGVNALIERFRNIRLFGGQV